MNLKLGIVEGCQAIGCRVKLVGDNVSLDTIYSDLVRDTIRIRRNQLVAVNVEASPPQIVCRWIRAQVKQREGSGVWVEPDHHPGELGLVRLVPELALAVEEGDRVFCCSVTGRQEVHDLILNDEPAHPDRLLNYIHPAVLDAYQSS